MRELGTVSVSSAGKTFSFTGWRAGGHRMLQMLNAVRTTKQFLTFVVASGPFQYAVSFPTSISPPCARRRSAT